MANYDRISQLITHWSEFEKENPGADFASFGRWLSSTQQEKEQKRVFLKKQEEMPQAFESSEELLSHHLRNMHKDKPLNVQIPILFGRINRYARRYIKQAYGDELSITLDEFQIMVTTAFMKNPKKSDVFNMNLMEATTGTEIIRRLMKLKYIKQVQNKEDKRSKLLSLTPVGEKVLWKAFEHMQYIGTLVTANLTTQQKERLMEIMEYLNDFHANIFLRHRDESVRDIVERFVK